MVTAHNDYELRDMLLPALKQAADYTADEILKTNKDKIQKWVYNKYDPEEYQRTYDFKEKAWVTHVRDKKTPNPNNSSIDISMDYDPYGMSVGSKASGTHVSVVDWSDIRDGLADIIYQGLAGDIFGNGAWTKARDAYAQLEKTLEKSYGLAKYVEVGMRKAGLKFKINDRNFAKTVT